MKPYYEQDGCTIYHGDCLLMNQWPSHDCVVTDPPYGTGGWRRPTSGAGRNPAATLFREHWDKGSVDWLAFTQAPILTFWPAQFTEQLLTKATDTDRHKHRALYMRKLDPKPQVGGRVKWSMEPIWVLSGDGFLLYGGDDVVDATTPRVGRDGDANGHPYQKPEHVMTWMVSKLPPSVLTVIDPFMGSGTTLVAAKRLGKSAVGIEQDEQYCEIAAKRLQQGALPLELGA